MAIAAGSRLGPYEILAPLGAGGMGEVYKARDPRLGREVAIKVLPEGLSSDPERLARFEKEARSASALNHPSIVTIYDVGRDEAGAYLAMELVEGQTLRALLSAGPLPIKKAVAIAAQLADGLARAHEAGIVHRDLKPENVMVRPDGLVKILDFGLAKLARNDEAAAASQAPTGAALTEAGVVLGTVGYMSPEQASGAPVDFRSDQFSLGAILYEMTAGLPPFRRGSTLATLAAILKEEPEPLSAVCPSVPEPLRWIIERCLAKDPDERYHSTRDLARDLAALRERAGETSAVSHRLPRSARAGLVVAAILFAAGLLAGWLLWRRSHPAAPGERDRSIAILPFQNFGGRAGDEYFSDGVTESLITDLARVEGLLIIARNSAFQYKGGSTDVRRVGRELGVRYVLEGSVQREGDSVRVNVQLIDARTGYHLWADKYDRPLRDIFALQDDISRHVVSSLEVALRPAGPPGASSPRPDLGAYDAYLRGLFYLNSFDFEQKDLGIPLLERAVSLDPAFARAHAALGTVYAKKAFEGDPDGTWRAKARSETEKALALDSNLAEAYVARGNLAWTLANGFPHEKASADYRRALALSPNLQPAHTALASIHYHVGLLDEAVAGYRKALRLDPNDLTSLYRLPRIALYQQKYAEALAGFDAIPKFRSDFLKPITLAHLGRVDEALAAARAGLTNPTHSRPAERADVASTLAVLLALSGDRSGAEEKIAEAMREGQGNSHFHHAAYNVATTLALMGRKEEALRWLEKTAAEGMPAYPLFEKDPYLDGLSTDTGFRSFLERMKAQWERFRTTL